MSEEKLYGINELLDTNDKLIKSEIEAKKYINKKSFQKYETILCSQNKINIDFKNEIIELSRLNDELGNKLQCMNDDKLDLQQRLLAVENNVRNNNNIIVELSRMLSEKVEKLTNAEINLQCNNHEIELLKMKIEKLEVEISLINKAQAKENLEDNEQENIYKYSTVNEKDNEYTKIDYYDFENYFRGAREEIKQKQKQYVQFYVNKSNVIDLGCGRGEFLELLRENNISAKGVDLYPQFVQLCKMRGLDVCIGDALQYLKQIEMTDGIFVGQLVEHLEVSQIISICELAYEKLIPDSYIILETPNPKTLAIYTNAFYLDPSHVKPVHPMTLQYFLKKAGFKEVQIIYTQESKLPISIPKLESNHIENLDCFNETMQMVSELLFGSQDYAIIAKK